MGLLRRYEGFRWLWFGQFLSQLGNAVFLIMGLWEIQLRSPFLLSIAGLVMALPSLFSMVGGVFVDRHDARRLMLWTDILRGTCVALGMLALAIPGSLVAVIIVLLGVNSLGGALFSPAESVLIPMLVPEPELAGANGIYSLTYQLSNAVGLAIGGAAIAAIGVAVVFGLDMTSFWLSALGILLMMRVVAPRGRTEIGPADEAAGSGSQGLIASLRAGFDVLKILPIILQLLPVVVVVNFAFAAAFTMLPYWIHHTLHTNVLWYGLISASWAVGLVGGGLSTGYFGRWRLRVSLTVTFALMSLLIATFAVVRDPAVSAGLLLAAGVFNGIGNALFFTMFQRLIPAEARGRAFGLLVTLFGVASPLGTLAAGLSLHLLPLWWSWGLAGLSGVASAGAIWVYMPNDVGGEPEAMASGA